MRLLPAQCSQSSKAEEGYRWLRRFDSEEDCFMKERKGRRQIWGFVTSFPSCSSVLGPSFLSVWPCPPLLLLLLFRPCRGPAAVVLSYILLLAWLVLVSGTLCPSRRLLVPLLPCPHPPIHLHHPALTTGVTWGRGEPARAFVQGTCLDALVLSSLYQPDRVLTTKTLTRHETASPYSSEAPRCCLPACLPASATRRGKRRRARRCACGPGSPSRPRCAAGGAGSPSPA